MSEQDRQAIVNSLNENIGSIDVEAERAFINELVEVTKMPLKKIPEPVFREIFLPYFTGEKIPDNDNPALAHWIGLVGSATEPAEVVNVKGEVLFEVPPVINTSKIDTSRSGSSADFGTIFSVYEDQAKVHPALGKKYLVESLASKTEDTIKAGEPQSHSWQPMLEYYKLVPKKEDAIKAAKNAAAAATDEGLEFGD